MKTFMKIAALAFGLGFSASAHAEVYVRITGSTAFRAATMTAIKNTVDMTRGVTGSLATDGYGFDSASGKFTRANYAIFRGVLKVNGVPNGTHVTIKCNWSGAVQGIKDTVQQNLIKFFTDDPTGANVNGAAPTVALDNSAGTNSIASPTNTEKPDTAMGDNTQGETPFKAGGAVPALTLATNGNTLLPNTAGCVGIVPFAVVAGKNAPSGLTNINHQQFQSLFQNGQLDSSVLTGNSADATTNVNGSANASGVMIEAIGRNPYSGTHVNYFGETNLGIKLTPAAQQIPYNSAVYVGPGFSSATTTQVAPDASRKGTFLISSATSYNVDTMIFAPADATVGAAADGDNGFDSGGPLSDMMRCNYSSATDANGFSGILCPLTVMGEGDSVNAVFGTTYGAGANVTGGNSGNAKFINWCGVQGWGGHPFSTTVNAVIAADGTVTVNAADQANAAGLVVGQLVKPSGAVIPAPARIIDVSGLPVSFKIATYSVPSVGTAQPIVAGSASVSVSCLLTEPLRNGSYTFWGYEYMMSNTANVTYNATAVNAICKQATTVDYFQSGFHQSYMRAKRNGTGQPVTQNF